MRQPSITMSSLQTLCLAILGGAFVLPGCGGGSGSESDDANSGFTDGADGTTSGPDGDATATDDNGEGPDPGSDDGEPGGPGEGEELCDAGDEAWAKRAITFIQGRRPESIREVRLLAQMVRQLDERGEDGRAAVARGLARGDDYRSRWGTYLFDQLRINRNGDRRNELCYDVLGAEANSPDLAAFIRDNTAEAQYPGPIFRMPDVTQSALRLDDISTVFRADLFARMSAPVIAGNVSATELEELRRANLGANFELAYLGRTTECNECHRTENSVTFDPNPDLNRHFPIPGEFEQAVYGPQVAIADSNRSYAVFRFFNFAYSQENYAFGNIPGGTISAFGMDPVCGAFRMGTPGPDPLTHAPYLVSDYSGGPATIYELDELLKQGFDELRAGGLVLGEGDTVDPPMAAAYLFAMNAANHAWKEAMGFPLTVANNFPRNPAQRDNLQLLADAFVSDGFSLRTLITAIATHDYFNQAPPAECGAATPYNLPAIFDPFTKSAADPQARGNGVGDGVHRWGAWLLLDSIARSMWWDRPDRFGPDTGQTPEFNCGGNMPQVPCVEEPVDSTVLRDLGAFLSDSDSGFEGTDLVTLLRLENDFGSGGDPGLHGACTGPLGSSCAADDYIAQLVDTALAQAGTDMWDVAAAIKDRLLSEPAITSEAERIVLEGVMGVSLTQTVAQVGAASAEQAARSLAGMLMSTPQFLLAGVPLADHDDAEDPVLVVAGTSTDALCEYLAPFILNNPGDGVAFGYTCSDDGVQISD